jgi:hypothetical protein
VVEAELTNRLLVAPEQQFATSSAQQQQQQQPSLRFDRSSSGSGGAGPSSTSQKKAKHDSAARHIQAKALLQKTLTQLQAEHSELLPRAQGSAQQQRSRNAQQLYKVYQTPHRNSRTLQEFLRYLNNSNQKGTNLHNSANLRLSHLLQPPRAPR